MLYNPVLCSSNNFFLQFLLKNVFTSKKCSFYYLKKFDEIYFIYNLINID